MISAPDRRRAVELIEEAVEAGASAKKACEQLQISHRSYQRWSRGGQVQADRRPEAARAAPANRLSEEERRRILEACNREEFSSLPPSQIVPALADRGEYIASESSFYRVLKEADQLHHRGKAQAARKTSRPEGYQATGPNQVWSWDITYLATTVLGLFFRLYLVMDIYSRKIVGWEIHEHESAEHASVLIHKACLAEGVGREGLVLHSDNGAPMKGSTMLATLQRLGVVASFSRPAVSDDNPFSEALFRTLKYRPDYPERAFESLSEARSWVEDFVRWYNSEHRHSALKFVTPQQRHRGEDVELLAHRDEVYQQARARHPQRWSGRTRNWEPAPAVTLPTYRPTAVDRNSKELTKAA
jgi:transposase InsO family protein